MLPRIQVFLCAALLFFAFSQSVQASPAKDALEIGLTSVLNLIKDPGYADPIKRKDLQAKIISIVKQQFDFWEFSARTVGNRWREFSAAQQQDFSNAFADLLIATYIGKIDGYDGQQILYTGEKTSPKGDRAEVMTVVSLKGGKKIPISYRLLPKNGTWKVYDVLVENISLVKNYRTQFQDILQSSTPEQLIERIKSKTVEAKQNNAKK